MKTAFSILLVCTGNTCRSPMAEALLKAELKARDLGGVRVSSAGIGADGESTTTPSAIDALARLGVKTRARRSRPVTEDGVAGADLVLTMTGKQKQRVALEYPWALAKTFVMPEFSGSRRVEIADPIGGSERDYLNCAVALRAEARKVVPRIRRILGKRRSER